MGLVFATCDLEGCISGEREGENGGKAIGNKEHNCQAQNRGRLRIV